MSEAFTMACTGYQISAFADDAGSPTRTQYMATVIWRGGGMRRKRPGFVWRLLVRVPGLASRPGYARVWWMATRARFRVSFIWHHLLPLYGKWTVHRFLPGLMKPPDREWASTAGGEGKDKREVKFSGKRRVVRIRDRDFSLPNDGRMLVLLVEESRGAPGGINVVERAIDPPSIERTPIDRSLPKEARIEVYRAQHELEGSAWHAAMNADPVISKFIADSAAPPAST